MDDSFYYRHIFRIAPLHYATAARLIAKRSRRRSTYFHLPSYHFLITLAGKILYTDILAGHYHATPRRFFAARPI